MTWRSRIYFLCGQLGLMALVRFLLSWAGRFADRPQGDGGTLLNVALVGVAFFGFRVFDAVTDPVAGAVGDAWAASGRERRRLLWFSLAFPAVGLVLAFAAGPAQPAWVRWTLFLIGLTVFFLGYTLYAIPYWSLVDDFAGEDAAERRTLSSFLGFGLILATAVVGVVSPFAVRRLGYGVAALVFAIPAAACMTLPYFAQPAAARARARPPTPRVEARALRDLLRGAGRAFRHRRFAAFLVLFSGSQMAFTVITTGLPFLAVRLLGGTDEDVARLMAPFLLTALPAFALAPRLSRRYGWQRVATCASVGLAIVYAGTSFLGVAVIGDPLRTAQVLFGCGGPFAALILGLEAEAITECARDAGGEVQSLYWGVFNFLIKALNGLAMAMTLGLAWMSGRPEAGSAAVRAMGPLAGALLLAGVVGYFFARVRLGAAAAPAPAVLPPS